MMDDKKLDVRVKKTYRKLVDGMLDLLSKKMLEDISVLEICEISGVHRATFYKHFDDKYAFLKFFFEMLLKELPCEQIYTTAANDDCRKAYIDVTTEIIRFAESHRKLIENVTDINQSQLFVALFTDAVTNLLREIIGTRLAKRAADTSEVPLFASFYASAMVGLLRWWVLKGTDFSASDIEKFAENRVDELISLYEK